MVKDVIEREPTLAKAATEAGDSELTGGKWLGRYVAEGEAGLGDKRRQK
ncbi:hypothetical protein HY522_08525 [bacterium]|nr:hypothetical protein [bacterium]